MGGARHHAKDHLESEASLLEDCALVKLAYVSLCQSDYASALRYSRRLLEKGHLLPHGIDGSNRETPAPAATAKGAVNAAVEEAKKHWGLQTQTWLQSPLGSGMSPATPVAAAAA